MVVASDSAEQFWDEVDSERWAETFPPWRPIVPERQLFSALFAPHRGGRAALMGSTPELRDLMWSAQLSTEVVERSASMYQTMSRQCRDTSLETFRESDWVGWFEQCPDDSYDVVAGDLVIRILTDDQVRALFTHLRRALKPTGSLCLRVHICPDPPPKVDPEQLLASYGELRLFDEWVVDRLFFSLSEGFAHASGEVDIEAMTAALVAAAPERALTELFVAKWGSTPITCRIRSQAQLEELAGLSFEARILPSQLLRPATLHVIEWKVRP